MFNFFHVLIPEQVVFIFRRELGELFAIQKAACGMIKNKYGDNIKYTAKLAISAVYFCFGTKYSIICKGCTF